MIGVLEAWKENLLMEQRVELIREWKEGENITALAEAYGVSRKTVYKWIARQSEEGRAGLEAHSCAPHNSPQQWGQEMIQRVRLAAVKFARHQAIRSVP